MAKSSGEIAIELRGKFEFYLLGLTFGILGLSIQTAKFGSNLAADAFELAGWGTLFLSGIIGILRAEWIPVAYDINSKINRIERQRDEVQAALQHDQEFQVPFIEGGQQTMVAGAEAIPKLEGLLTTLEKQHDDVSKKVIARYGRMRAAFLIGIGCLMVARGIPPAVSLAERLKPLLERLIA